MTTPPKACLPAHPVHVIYPAQVAHLPSHRDKDISKLQCKAKPLQGAHSTSKFHLRNLILKARRKILVVWKPQGLQLRYSKAEWNAAVCVNYACLLLNQTPPLLPSPLLPQLVISYLRALPYTTQTDAPTGKGQILN